MARSRSLPPGHARDIIAQLEPARDWRGENEQERYHDRAIVRGSVKVLARTSGGSEFYDLESDPGEHRPNPSSISTAAEQLVTALAEADASLAERSEQTAKTYEVDEATRLRLRALGYGVE